MGRPNLDKSATEKLFINKHYKFLRVSDMRELEKLLAKEEITYSRMVELINEIAFDFYDSKHPLKLNP